jgi:hypothetical protein
MRRILVGMLIVLASGCSSKTGSPTAELAAPAGSLKIHGPFVHEHLALYVVEDPSAKSAGDFITLAEGLASGQVKVSEKKEAQVNELLIENASGKPCFVQAGDVVKGGQQDRTIARDFVIPAKTAPAPIASFCVEHSRWQGKGAFEASTQNAYGRDLKMAVQGMSSQSEVWKEVAKNKQELAGNNGLSAPKTSSLNEELDDAKIKERMSAFKAALAKIVEGRPHAVGVIAAVNGRFSTADVYADPGLFRKLFPRLLESATLEALTLKSEAKPAPDGAQAAAFLCEAEKGQSSNQKIREGLEANTIDSAKCVQFDYRWMNESLHKQTLSK